MKGRDSAPPKPAVPNKAEARAARARRLAEALRANLRRRKDQSRGRADPPGQPPPGGDNEK